MLITAKTLQYIWVAQLHQGCRKYSPEGGFLNDLRETLTYGELLKHEFYPSLRNYG